MQRISRAERRRSSRELAKRPQWETLEEFTRSRIQTWIQDLLEEEVTELLGRLFELSLHITLGYVALALGVSSIVGVASGWYPASRAAKLDPVVALRAE